MGIAIAILGTVLFTFVIWSLLKLDECEAKAYLENFYRGHRPPKQGKSVWGLPEPKTNVRGKHGIGNEKNF